MAIADTLATREAVRRASLADLIERCEGAAVPIEGGPLDGIETSLSRLEATTRLLLGLRILADGHAKNLGEASRIAQDLDQIRVLYPEAFR